MGFHIHCSIVYNGQDTERTYVSIDKWMNKENVVYTHTHRMEDFQPLKKRDILPFATMWMDFDAITPREISLTETNTVWSHLHVELEQKQNPSA